MIRVGLTGGIGSGKSTVARLLAMLGVPVYDSDARGKWLMTHDPAVIDRVRQAFGEAAYRDSRPDTRYLAARVFDDPAQLRALNAIVHPAVRADFAAWADAHAATADYVVAESAVLFESGMADDVDRVVAVTAPEALRLARTARRDALPPAAIRRRMAAQLPESERLARADDVLDAGEEHLLIPQVIALDRKLRALAAQQT